MSEPSRARRFDGFERLPIEGAAVPEAGLDRILEALTRSRAYLPQAIERKLAELWDSDTALALAVLLGLWAGLQFTPVGWLADLLAAAYGVASLGADLLHLVEASQHAASAETDSALDAAAREMAQALTESAAEILSAILGGVLFARLRRLVRLARVKLLPRRFGRGAERALTLGDRLIGASAGVSLETGSPALGQKKKELERSADRLTWKLALGGGTLLVGGLVAISRRGQGS
jgi:hypothetical protein